MGTRARITHLGLAGSLAPSRTSVLSGHDEVVGGARLQAASNEVEHVRKRLAGFRSAAAAVVVAPTSVSWAAPAVVISRQNADSIAAQAVHVASAHTRAAFVEPHRSINAAANILN